MQKLIDFDAATAARDAGLAVALANAPADWATRVREVAGQMQGEFLMEQVREIVESEGLYPKSNNAWGSITVCLAKAGIIHWTGNYRNTSSVRTHAHPAKTYTA